MAANKPKPDQPRPKHAKQFMLCINKADYLSEELIAHWNQYFKEKGVNHIFFSAKKEQEKLDGEAKESGDEESEDSEAEQLGDEEKEFEPLFGELKNQIDLENEKKEEEEKQGQGKEQADEADAEVKQEEAIQINTTKVFSRVDILEYLRLRAKEMSRNYQHRLHVGTVGYPNVGKSSLINVLCGRKRVGVAAMPGKTKHFQTLLLENTERDICLVDCPGLVFPSFANSKAEMYCCGVLPIQTITEYMTPVSLITHRIAKQALEQHYKIRLPPQDAKSYTANTFLNLFAMRKGWVTGNSNPNTAQAAKQVLKDYTTGQIVFCHLRPDYSAERHGAIAQSGFKHNFISEEEPADPLQERLEEDTQTSAQVSMSTALGGRPQNEVAPPHHSLHANKSMPVLANDAEEAFEAQLDKDFFQAANKAKKAKLTKAEKRALKFMARREEAQSGELLFDEDESVQDVDTIKAMLANDRRQKKSHKNFVETGGGQKFVGAKGNHSNKLID